MVFEMWTKRLVVGLVFLVLPSSVWAQKPVVVPLVTEPHWSLAKSQKLSLDDVRQWNGDPAVEREYGVREIERQAFHMDNQSAETIVEKAADASSAYGLLTFYQTDIMTPEKDMPLVRLGPRVTLMARGPFFIRIPLGAPDNTELSRESLRSLLIALGGLPSPSQPRANVPPPLPAQGFISGSEKYLLGEVAAQRVLPNFRTDLIGFAQGAEARLASYRSQNERVRVLAITYPTPQIARARFETMRMLLGIDNPQETGKVFGKRSGSFVILVLDASSRIIAENVLKQFASSQEVTWNERYPGDESMVIQVVRLVLANFLLTAILGSFGIFGGLAFFGSKWVAHKWFPNSTWGQPDESTIIRLNLDKV
jgi:hypothetical protein